jgi:hypothetical protein
MMSEALLIYLRGLLVLRPALYALGIVLIAATGCVESRDRYMPVPSTPTVTPVASPTPVATPVTPTPVPPTAIPTAIPTATPSPTSTPVPPTPIPTATPSPTVTPTPTAAPIPTSTGTFNLSLDFEGIGDESIVRSDTVLLRGSTSTDAIVSVNGVILEIQPDGTFELTLALDPGPNIVDVVASDIDGSSINSSLAIISIPPEDAA